MQASGRQPQRASDGAPPRYERHRPAQTTLYRLVQQHAASFIVHTEACTGSALPRFLAPLVDHVIPHSPVRQWVLSLPIPLRVLLAAQLEPVMQVVQVVQRVVMGQVLGAVGLNADEGHGGAATLILRFGATANLKIHLHRLGAGRRVPPRCRWRA